MRYCSCIKMVLDKVVNLKEFWWPNKEIKYFSRSSTEFKVLSRQLVKFKTFWRFYEPWLFLLWCFLARTKHNCCLWCMIEFNCAKVWKPIWEAISFNSGTNGRLMIKITITMIEFFDRWLRMKIFTVEIIDWVMRTTSAII